MSTQKRERKAQDPEITVLKACMRQLESLPFAARGRVARYLNEYAHSLNRPTASEPNGLVHGGPAQEDPFG